MQKILVTGVNGFVGHHMAQELNEAGYYVYGLGREGKPAPGVENSVDTYISCDLAERKSVEELPFGELSAIINLAGLANVAESFRKPELYEKVNIDIISNLVGIIAANNFPIRLIAVSTGAVYEPSQAMPLNEESALVSEDNTSPYVKSKLLMEQVVNRGVEKGVDAIIARPFNHIGPGQGPGFLVPDLCSKIASSAKNGKPITVGNIKTRRDYTDVRDVVRAYNLLATLPKDKLRSPIYNICSGVSRSGLEIAELIKKMVPGAAGVSFDFDKSLFRATDPMELKGDSSKLQSDTGWKPEIQIEQTIKDYLDWFETAD